jgi:hypothetical protein
MAMASRRMHGLLEQPDDVFLVQLQSNLVLVVIASLVVDLSLAMASCHRRPGCLIERAWGAGAAKQPI